MSGTNENGAAQVLVEPPFDLPTKGGTYDYRDGKLVAVDLTNVEPEPVVTKKAGKAGGNTVTLGA